MLHAKIMGTGKPLVILHGVTLDHRYMIETLEPAFDGINDWCRIYVDLPGHGKSPAQDSVQTQDDVLEAVQRCVTNHIGQAPFGVIGYSRGSYIARGLIYRWPDRVRGAALLVPGGNPGTPNPLPDHEIREPDPTLRADLSEREIWAFDNFSVVQRHDVLEKRRRVAAPAIAIHDQALEARIQQAFHFSFAAAEETMVFQRPSLLVTGRQDWISGYLDAVDLMHRYPHATLATLDAAGHGLALERPEVLTALVRDWLHRVAVDWAN